MIIATYTEFSEPPKYIFHGTISDQERHVGNAVPPLLAEALAIHFGTLVHTQATEEVTAPQIFKYNQRIRSQIYNKKKLPVFREERIKGSAHATCLNERDAHGIDLDEATSKLVHADPKLARLIDIVGPCQFQVETMQSPFEAIMKAIIYQQLTLKAASAIYARVEETVKTITPTDIINASEEELRKSGLSWAKIASLKDLARKTSDGVLPPIAQLQRMEDEEIINRLLVIRGVGRWTVEMLLISLLGRPDVLPVGDYAIRKGFALTYNRKRLPSQKEIIRRGYLWRPFRTVATWYLWKSLDLPPNSL